MFKWFFILLLGITIQAQAETFPIKVLKGLIVSEAIIEGKSAMVILDTGAPGLVLNSKYYKSDKPADVSCVGINGGFDCQKLQVKEWSWLGTNHKRTQALVSDLSFLERALNREIHALIGFSVLEDYFITVDLDHNVIHLSKEVDAQIENSFTRFHYAGHLPVLPCKVNGQKKALVLDTGSESNYLFNDYSFFTERNHKAISPIIVYGPDNKGEIKHCFNMYLEVIPDEIESPTEFIIDLSDDDYFSHDSFDGILGQSFLSQFNMIIHPGKQKILLSPRNQNPSLVADNCEE